MSEPQGTYERSMEEKTKKRRTRNDDEGRNFNCTCGKSYLSYPALYTHIKTKHGGKAEFNRGQSNRDQGESSRKDDQDLAEDALDEASNLQILQKYLNSLFPFTQKDRAALRVFSPMEDAYLKSIKEYWEKHKKQEQVREGDVYGTSIDYVLGLFSLEMESELSFGGKHFMSELVLDIRKGLNELKSNQTYCQAHSASDLPNLMNDLVLEKLLKVEEGHLYRKQPTLVCKTLFHMARWLFHSRFTNLSLKFNSL